MKTARVSLCLAILLSWALASPVAAQQSLPPGQDTFGGWPDESMPGTDDIHTRSIFDRRNIMLQTDGGDGTGYLRGQQTFAAFQPIQVVPDEFILWMSPRGYITFNSGNFAGNLGTGFRWLNQETQRIIGGGAWWDHDNNGLNNYDQLGGSLEWLGKYFDLRANAYIPTNQNVHQIAKFFNNNNVFILNNIGVGQTTITNSALRGGDFEAGGALPGIGDLGLRTYVGGYYYQGPASEGGIYGVRARIEALVTQDMWGTVAVSHDRVFGTNVTCAATFYLFTGNETQWFRRIPMETRLYQQMERQYRVAVQKSVANDTILALRAGGTGGSGGPVGTPIFVLHVDNTAPAGGNGTVENPLNFLPTTTGSNVDIVFVHRGTGTSFNMNQGTTLNNFERLLGQGVPHQFTDTLGTFNLPGFSSGPLPSITNVNPGGSAVTLASHNEVSGFNIANSALHGITGSNIVDFNINNVNITASGNSLGPVPIGAGVQLTNATGTGLVTQSTLIGNNAEGFRVDNSAGGTLNLTVANVQANSNLTGIMLNGTGATINPTVTQTTANSNVRDGISITLANSGATRSAMTGSFDHVTASGNNPSGTGPTLPSGQLLFGNGFTYNSTTSDAVISITHSTFDNNRLNGVSFTTSADSSLSASLVNNNTTINGNIQNGVLFTNTDSQVFATLLNNTINNNGGFGIGVVSKGTGAFGTNFVLNVGGYLTQDTNADGVLSTGEDGTAITSLGPSILGNGILDKEGNTITGNHGAGISFTMQDQGLGSANIIGNTIQNTAAGQAPQNTTIFTGQGIDLRLTGSTVASNSVASFTGGTIDKNTIGSVSGNGNAGSGIVVFADQNTSLQNLNIGTIGLGNIIASNGGDGINITRGNTAHVGTVIPLLITDNVIRLNGDNGVSIQALNSFDGTVNGFILNRNNISNNVLQGVQLHVEADAQMDVGMHQNAINNNGLNGIHTDELTGSAGDQRGISGTWDQNTITFNGANGIHLAAASGTALGNLLIGNTTDVNFRNIISNNTSHGILMNGPGVVTVGFNTIESNAAGGIYINAPTVNIFTITNNIIANNGTANAVTDGGDGIQIVNTGVFGAFVFIDNNTIRSNVGRGINILNRGNSSMAVTIDTNSITNNGLEGIYAVNTSSLTQSADALSTTALVADGTVFRSPRLTLSVVNNDIEGNGINSGYLATGLVIRVGTSDGGRGNNDDGGFFSEGRGGVGATVTDNVFHGNLGDDLSFSSFVSTVAPITAAGTWDAATFSVTAYQSDPLSRLDLSFHNNTFDSTPLNVGQGSTNNGANAVAFYNDSDGTFKSRINSATPAGPFTTATRARNATRLGGRFLGVLAPFAPDFGVTMRYPGMGMSTFRLLDASNGGATTAADVAAAGFFTDGVPYTNPFIDANGVLRAGFGADDLPYGWTFLDGAAEPARPQ